MEDPDLHNLVFRIPTTNEKVFRHLYIVENGLRELIVARLSSIAGPRWHKTRLPGDVLEKYRQARQYEMSLKWWLLTPFHPLYYVDFPDLKKIIVQKQNWKDVFCDVFGTVSVVDACFQTLEPIRNAIAHNRKVSSAELEHTISASARLLQCVGPTEFIRLSSKTSEYLEVADTLQALHDEIAVALRSILAFREARDLSIWAQCEHAWWFDEDYLGQPVQGVVDFFSLVAEYNRLPRGRGKGLVIEEWVNAHKAGEIGSIALSQLTAVLATQKRLK